MESISQLTGVKLITPEGTEELVPSGLSRNDVMRGEAAFFQRMIGTKDFTDPVYLFAKKTALTVREMCDAIRKQNGFLF